MPENAELQLVAAAQAGDFAAFHKLYELYLPPVAAFARRASPTVEAAEELTQAILGAVFSHLDGFTGRVALAAWVLVVARKVAERHAGG